MNLKIVQAIRKKLGLDEKLSNEKFKQFVTCKDSKGQVISESILNRNGYVVAEATKLSKKEEAITDTDEIQKYIKKYQDAISGKKVLNNKKTGKPLSSKYLKQRLKLWKDKLESSGESGSGNESEADAEITGSDAAASTDSSKEESKGKGENAGYVYFATESAQDFVVSVGNDVTADEKVESASKTAAVAEGGDEAKKELSGNEEAPKEEKKGFFNKIGEKLKAGIQKVTGAVKDWYAKQNVWVKRLIWVIIAVITIAAIIWLIVNVIWPIFGGLIVHGTFAQKGQAIFSLIAAGKTFHATYKAGKTAWTTGEGWGKFFMMCVFSIMAVMTIKGLADMGKAKLAEISKQADSSSSGAESKRRK